MRVKFKASNGAHYDVEVFEVTAVKKMHATRKSWFERDLTEGYFWVLICQQGHVPSQKKSRSLADCGKENAIGE